MTAEETNRTTAKVPEHWRVGDLVDFEVLLAQDERAKPEVLRQRDEGIPREFHTLNGSGLPKRSKLFLFWTRKRRGMQFGHEPAPGEQVESFFTWATVALAIIGLALARALVWSFFRSPETTGARPEPVNVFWFVAVCIGIPLLLTIYGFWLLFGLRAAPSLPRAPAFLRGTLLNLLRRPVTHLVRKISELSGAEKRLAAEAAWGAFRQRAVDGGSAIALRLTCAAQILGLSFTLGILIFSWFDCLFHSRVFGWQTTVASVTPEAAHRFVRGMAMPWSWFLPEGQGYPTFEQLAATRFVRYQDPAAFPEQAASAWANFLVAAVLVYGFLPRGLLYFISRWQLRRALAAPDFSQARYDRLWERLTIPQVAIGAPPDAGSGESGAAAALGEGAAAGTECIVLMPEELISPERQRAVADWLAARKQWRVRETRRFEAEVTAPEPSTERVVLVHESFMPPVKSVLKKIKQMRQAAPETGLAVGLIGKPSHEPLGAPPSRTDYDVWQAKLQSLGDANIDFFSFREPQL